MTKEELLESCIPNEEVELFNKDELFSKKYTKDISYMVKFIDGSVVHITYDDFQHYTAQLNNSKDNKLINCADSHLYINPNNVTMIVKETK